MKPSGSKIIPASSLTSLSETHHTLKNSILNRPKSILPALYLAKVISLRSHRLLQLVVRAFRPYKWLLQKSVIWKEGPHLTSFEFNFCVVVFFGGVGKGLLPTLLYKVAKNHLQYIMFLA